MMIHSLTKIALLAAVSLLLPSLVRGGVIVYGTGVNGGLAGFNTMAGNPPIAIDFDGITPGTDITGSTIAGVQFLGPNAPLQVVRGADTFTPGGFSGTPNPSTNRLLPTSGQNVLSPGGTMLGPGPNTSIEDDDLTLVFSNPLAAFGFDHLSQSADGFSFTGVQVFNLSNSLLFSGTINISNFGGGGAPGGADFWGVVATGSDLIGRIIINEQDGNSTFPDSNIGFDSFRFAGQVIPEPSSLTLMGCSVLGGLCYFLRRKIDSSGSRPIQRLLRPFRPNVNGPQCQSTVTMEI